MRIHRTQHYRDFHEDEAPWEVVCEVIRTTRGRRMGHDLVEFLRRSKRRGVYVLCNNPAGSDVYRVINAKVWRR